MVVNIAGRGLVTSAGPGSPRGNSSNTLHLEDDVI